MATFTTKIIRRKLTLSPFSPEQMMTVGTVALDHIIQRIRQAKDVMDAPARPLAPKYADLKARGKARSFLVPGRAPIRDWYLRGVTLGSLKVKSASEDKVTLGPTTQQADQIITVQNRRQKQWGMSPSDTQVLHAVLLETLKQPRRVYWSKSA